MAKTKIEIIGLGSEDWTDTLVDEDEGIESVAEWERYGTIEVRIGGVTYEVGCVIGVPEYLRATARAAGGDTVTPYITAWWEDAYDYQGGVGEDGTFLDPDLADDVLGAIMEAAPQLWEEVKGDEKPTSGPEFRDRIIRLYQHHPDGGEEDTVVAAISWLASKLQYTPRAIFYWIAGERTINPAVKQLIGRLEAEAGL